MYCDLSGGEVAHTQDLGAVWIYWDTNGEISGVEIMNVRSATFEVGGIRTRLPREIPDGDLHPRLPPGERAREVSR